jgi:hypothetical protein
MIIRVESDTAEHVEGARRELEALVRSWGHDLAETSRDTSQTSSAAGAVRVGDKGVDPVAVSALVLSLPSAALAVFDLADRIQKRRRAKELIDHAQQLATQQVTVSLVSQGRPLELATMAPDQLLDALEDEGPTD